MKELFIGGLFFISVLTTLTVEGIKKTLDEQGKKYKSNLLAGLVATFLSFAGVVFYYFYYDITFNAKSIIVWISFVFLSWLCSMIGFDKVKQLINQGKGE